MNIFEFLGLPANHRPKNKVVQLVKHYNEVPASKKSFPLIGQAKRDGVYGLVVTYKGTTRVFGRTGEMLTSCGAIIQAHANIMPVDGVLVGEVLSRYKCSLEQLSGVLNPNRINELDKEQVCIAQGLYVAWHDCMSLSEFVRGASTSTYEQRWYYLDEYLKGTDIHCDIILCSTICDESSKDKFTAACLASGEEGAVYKQPEEMWVAGHKGYRQMKEVGEVAYDLECTRVEEGEGKYAGLVANMYFRWEGGSEIKAMPGKGHTHESCRQMWLDPQSAIGKIWKVKGLCKSSLGKVRLPKVEEQRHDKVTADY